MADGADALSARTLSSIGDIEAAAWDALANPKDEPFDPFISHAFLLALEESKSVCREAGWAPMHLVLEEHGKAVGVAPLYLKGNSRGEYVFDQHWADAFERAGGSYYPKLLSGVPFTPVPGRRLLASSQDNRDNLARAIQQVTAQIGASSAHVNFTSPESQTALTDADYLPRLGEQFHWFNRDYETYDDFLGALSSRKRKAIKRERRDCANADVEILRLYGNEISERHWDAFWIFYQDTGARKWGYPYLTRSFFRQIAETLSESLLLVVAEKNGEPIAGALHFIGGDALYGRYWGCTEYMPFLHFELCYHQAIDVAIERKLSRVEAGAQGQHKIARGYEPAPTYSAHYLANSSFKDAVARYLDSEREQTSYEIEALKSYTPFKKGPASS